MVSRRQVLSFYGFRGGRGGLTPVMVNLINFVSSQGLEVHLLLHDEVAEVNRIDKAVKIVRLGRKSELFKPVVLASYLKTVQPKVLLSSYREWGNRIAVVAKKIAGVDTKLVFRVGAAPSATVDSVFPPKRFLQRLMLAFSYRHADLILANSEQIISDIIATTGVDRSKIVKLNNPTIPLDVWERAGELSGHPWLDKPDLPVVLSVGRLMKVKDFPTLLRAFVIVRRQFECRLVIVGDGNKREELWQLATSLGIAEHFDMPGFSENPFSYMGRAALFVLSSVREGSPNVLIEALACGTPVVSTDCPTGPAEILENGKYGRLVPVGDVDKMAQAMIETLKQSPAPDVLQHAAQRYRADLCSRQYLEAMGLL